MSMPNKPAGNTPTSNEADSLPPIDLQKAAAARQEFMAAALSMSWQLAIVVLVPLLGGYKLDQHFDTLPLWTGVGFVLAMVGMADVVWRQMQALAPREAKK